jgi:predicted ATPase with chaperone activity
MIGPPGTGKSMLTKRIPTIMVGMHEEVVVETTKIHSARGFLLPRDLHDRHLGRFSKMDRWKIRL